MDLDWRRNKRQTILENNAGQSMVEYILLLAVVVALVSVVFNSDLVKGYFGDNGRLAEAFRGKIEYTYTHAVNGKKFFRVPNYDRHDSYNDRFYSVVETYPRQ